MTLSGQRRRPTGATRPRQCGSRRSQCSRTGRSSSMPRGRSSWHSRARASATGRRRPGSPATWTGEPVAWVKLRFQVAGEVQVSRAFEASADQVQDMRDPLGRVGRSILATVHEQFRTEGGYGGQRWKPLNRDYAAWKESQVGPEPILVFSGLMRSTLISGAAITVLPKRLVYEPRGPHAEIATYHQGGAPERGL